MMAGSDVTPWQKFDPICGVYSCSEPDREGIEAWVDEAGKCMASNVWNEVRKDLNSGTGVKK